MVNKTMVGEGKVLLIAGGGRVFTDMVARFVRSERDLESIISSPYDKSIVENILRRNHRPAMEFDYFIFGVEGFSRVTEIQLVRKRMASYIIKSGRPNKSGKRSFDMVIPSEIDGFAAPVSIQTINGEVNIWLKPDDILSIIDQWYDYGVSNDIPEQWLRYLKPQATEFKAIIGMNAHALMDWFQIRLCRNAQGEIRDMAWKMFELCQEACFDLFKEAGPGCKVFGYCPENEGQNEACLGHIIQKDQAIKILRNYNPLDINTLKEK